MNSYHIIGLMSGTSLDGVDVAYCRFDSTGNQTWTFEIIHTAGYEYPDSLLKQLKQATELPSEALYSLNKQLGIHFGEVVNQFLFNTKIDPMKIDAVASHGQTVFHQPENGFTLQIGCGTNLAVTCGIPVINDFRSKDIALGGQGAPLVPIGDQLLFSQLADSFLNIGGFCNASFTGSPPIKAFDICAGNLPLNQLMEQHYQLNYDSNGEKARSGTIHTPILNQLNELDFYTTNGPKSLGTEWLFDQFMPLLDIDISPEHQLATVVEHIATQVAHTLTKNGSKKVLVTGGGAKNIFLIERIQSKFEGALLLPSSELIDFKEAIVFGFLGALYLAGENNVLSSVTGAMKSSRGGILHTP